MGDSGSERPKRILFVENGIGYGGAVICLRHLVRALDRRRYEPIVVTGQAVGPYRGIAEDAQWFCIPDRWVDVTRLRARLESAHRLASIPGARALLLQFIARLDDVANFVPLAVRFLWTLARIRPAIVHANNEPVSNRAAIFAARVMRIPIVCHVRGDQSGPRSMAFWFRLPNHFIPVSQWIGASIAKIGIPAARSTLIYDGIDFSRLNRDANGGAFRAQYGIPSNAFAVGLPGVLIAWKGQELFLEAARILVRDFPDLFFVIIGSTPDGCEPFEQELRALAAERSLRGRVAFTGHVADMSDAYNGLDVVVSASTAPEPLGVVVVEAMAMERPVIAPAHGGALEVVEHERTGLLFAPNDAASLAAAMRRCRTDSTLLRSLAAAGRARVLETFSITRSVREVEGVYERLLRRDS